MYEIIKNVTESGRYELSDMLKKIDTVWVQGSLTDDQRAVLVTLAREHARPENSYAGIQEQIDTLRVEVSELRKLVTGGATGEPEEYPPYRQPTGAHDAYHAGDKVTYNGVRYMCRMDGCVWSPDVYPDAWELAK